MVLVMENYRVGLIFASLDAGAEVIAATQEWKDVASLVTW
jgi:hypothetical protein